MSAATSVSKVLHCCAALCFCCVPRAFAVVPCAFAVVPCAFALVPCAFAVVPFAKLKYKFTIKSALYMYLRYQKKHLQCPFKSEVQGLKKYANFLEHFTTFNGDTSPRVYHANL